MEIDGSIASMAICTDCEQEMLDSVSCTTQTVEYPDGEVFPSVPYGPIGDWTPEGKCHDCGCPVGGFHHPGCDMERCPRCHGQLISCGCLDEEEEEDNPGDLCETCGGKLDFYGECAECDEEEEGEEEK